MKKMIETGNYRTIQHEGIVKPQTIDADGPMGFSVFMGDPSIYQTCFYASECVMAATWNEELAYEYGKMIGNEGAIGNQKGGNIPYSGWYAPAMNIHRSQFGGRNFEYYSEDGLLSGKMAANVVQGAKTKGVYTYCKHFALNEQETNRDTTGLITWANEQAMRELYFVPFEIAVKEGETTAMMSAFNRIGTTWAGGNYNLLTALLREEWGFEGMVITDYNLTSYMNLDQMIRAGGDLNLSAGKAIKDGTSDTAITAMRASVKNILYTVANSNAMNGLGEGVGIIYGMPYWQIALVVFDCILFMFIGAWMLIFKRG
jgi:beta-glucosidase